MKFLQKIFWIRLILAASAASGASFLEVKQSHSQSTVVSDAASEIRQ